MAVIAMASACQVIDQPMTETGLEKATVLFTASLGAETKTVLDYDAEKNVYKNLWSEGDGLWVGALQSDGTYKVETCRLIDGIGTTNATFAGTLEADQYIAYQGYGEYGSWGITPYFQHYQGIAYRYNPETGYDEVLESYGSAQYPMYAVSNDKHFEFKNLASILKVSLTGTATINNVVFTTNDPSIAVSGAADIELASDGIPSVKMRNDSTATNSVIYQLFDYPLDQQKPLNCYIVLPPQVYKGGFTITINSTTGSMTKTVTSDVEFKRSEIRALTPIEYKEESVMKWALVGSMTEWANDIPMTLTDNGTYVLENFELKAEDEFKFRANGDWSTNFGGAGSLEEVYPGKRVYLYDHGSNMKVATPGVYNIVFNPAEAWAEFQLVEDPTMPVECSTYDEIAALPDGTLVQTTGFVFGTYDQGFILNVGYNMENAILVSLATFSTQPIFCPEVGSYARVVSYKSTNRDLPELTPVQQVEVFDSPSWGYDYYYSYYDFTYPEYFKNFNLEGRYYYVKVMGTLELSGSDWVVIVPGVDDTVVRIEYPSQDLSSYANKKVIVEGWFTGYSSSNIGTRLMTMVLSQISLSADNNGSTEDVIPGDDIVITKSRSVIGLD